MNKVLMLNQEQFFLYIFYVEAMRKYILRFHLNTKKEGLWVASNEAELFKTCSPLKRKISVSPWKTQEFSRFAWDEHEEWHLVKSTFALNPETHTWALLISASLMLDDTLLVCRNVSESQVQLSVVVPLGLAGGSSVRVVCLAAVWHDLLSPVTVFGEGGERWVQQSSKLLNEDLWPVLCIGPHLNLSKDLWIF